MEIWQIIVTTLCVLIGLFLAMCLLYGTIKLIYDDIINPSKMNTMKESSFSELLTIFNIVINSEIEEYNTDVFNRLGSLTNAQYENFYNDLCNKIIKSLSPNFIAKFSIYVTEDEIYKLIARYVKKYLVEHINPQENEEEE